MAKSGPHPMRKVFNQGFTAHDSAGNPYPIKRDVKGDSLLNPAWWAWDAGRRYATAVAICDGQTDLAGAALARLERELLGAPS